MVRHDVQERINNRHGFWRPYVRYIVAIVLALVCEIGMFNVPHWRSLETSAPFAPSIQMDTGLQETDTAADDYPSDNSTDTASTFVKKQYATGEYEGRTFETVGNNRDTQTFRVNTRNVHVNFLTLDFSRIDRDKGRQPDQIKVGIVGADEYNTKGIWLHSAAVSPITPESKRLDIVLSGSSPWIRVHINEPRGVKIRINQIIVNERVPFTFNPIRFAILLLVFSLIALLLPGSWVWQREWNESSVATWLTLAGILLMQLGMFVFLIKLKSPWFTLTLLDGRSDVSTIYQDQLRSILDGHPWLSVQPSDHLIAMEDPYDTSARRQLSHDGIVDDYAYFNGRYWCYFGILPVILFMLPVYAISGIVLDTWMMIAFCVLACVPASFWLIRAILKRYAPKATFGAMISILLAFPALTYVTSLMLDQRTYVLPSALGLLLCICAFASWFTAMRDDNTLDSRWIALGSLLMGMTLGARPTMSISALLVVPCFWRHLCRRLVQVRDWLAMLVPPLIVALPVLWWNRIRFGSWLDFGASYNLTNVNMTNGHPGLLESFPFRMFEILFRPITAEWRWPFIFSNPVDYEYHGDISSFSMSGGYFAYVPIAMYGLICAWILVSQYSLAKKNNYDTEKTVDGVLIVRAMPLIVCASLLAFALCLITSKIGGFSPRYDTDWAWILGLAVICGIGMIDGPLNNGDEYLAALVRFMFGMLAVTSLAFSFWQAVSGNVNSSLTAEYMIKLHSLLMPS